MGAISVDELVHFGYTSVLSTRRYGGLRPPTSSWVSTKTLCVPIDHHAIFKMFKLSFCGSDNKCQNIIFVNPFLGHFQKSLTGSESMCRSSFKKSAILMAKMAKKFQKLVPFLVHFQKIETGSESMCRFVRASSFQKWSKKAL